MEAATNLFNTPLEITPAAIAIAKAAMSEYQGVLNVAGCDRLSRYAFALAVAKAHGLDCALVRPVEDASGLRQPNSCLNVAKAEAVLNTHFEETHVGIARMARTRPFVAQRRD
jgi:dTDP-4-dehydrorhamnose reductase